MISITNLAMMVPTHPGLWALRLDLIIRLGGMSSSLASDADDAVLHRFVHSLCRQALDGATAVLGAEHPQTGKIAEECGSFARSLRDVTRAEQLYRLAAQSYTKHFGPDAVATLEVLRALEQPRAAPAAAR